MFKQKETLIILWLTFFTVVAWISLNIYHIWATSQISDIDASAITPIDPTFDTNTINKLKAREAIEPLYQLEESPEDNTASQEAQLTPSPTESTVPQVSVQP